MATHGLAATIRASEESETFDLGGQSASTIASTVESALREPLTLETEDTDMIRITLVVGAGKQARQKYDAGAMRAVTSALVKCGYVEDRGASCVAECGGTYKVQHDTGKNLKTIVVFPRVVAGTQTGVDGGGGGSSAAEPLLPENSPGHKIATASTGVFANMLSSRCPSWSEKRGCLGSLEALSDMLRELEDKLIGGAPLDDAKQKFYDDVVALDEKVSIVRREMHAQVEEGKVTEFERQLLLEQNAEKIAALTKENKPTARAMQRKELLESIEPIRPGKLRHEEDIRKLRRELAPLLQMEDAARGRLLTMKETQTLARKDDLVEEIAYLEESSRGWFEDDSAFESRLRASREVFETRRRQKAAGRTATIGADTKSKVSENKWVLPGERKGGSRGGGKKKKKIKGASAFSAMVLDSDDSDDNDNDDEQEEEKEDNETDQHVDNPKSGREAEVQQNAASANQGTKKKAKKKKKKQKSKELDPGTEKETPNKTGAGPDGKIAVTPGNSLLRTHILPLLAVLFGWLYALVFGKQKKHGRGRVKR